MIIRPYRPSDMDALATVYRDAVKGIGATAYDPEQVAVWASFPDEIEGFRASFGQGLTLVAEENDHVAAFGQLHPIAHIALLYTAPAFARRHLATEIYTQLEAYARQHGVKRLHTEASRIAKHFFTHMGFSVVTPERVVRQGVEFERFIMEKML